ncbi:MAG: hypothetical protein FWG51_00560 [Firmicutes bacterium]|nr:hypothetical protein [Bacillota bacterium]
MEKTKIYSDFCRENDLPNLTSLEEIEQKIEQKAQEEESDNIVLAEDKKIPE